MVTGPPDHGIQADVVFVIEGTATNGAYLNEFRTNYIVPTLEYFNQGPLEDRDYACETSLTLYGIVLYHASDRRPAPITEAYGPYSNPTKVLGALERLEMVGGKAESHANIGEGFATALQCFEDLQARRDPNAASRKHCILVCNSPPYQIGVQESDTYSGFTVEQLAGVFQEKNVSLSVLSPRRNISALFNLFEKAGGDLQSSQTKNYTKDPRHLVLLRNYSLKESPVSPNNAATVAAQAAAAAAAAAAGVTGTTNAAQMALSPLQSNDSPNPNQTPQSIVVAQQNVTQAQQQQQQQGPTAPYRGQTTPQNINSVHQQQQQAVNQQQQQPPQPPMSVSQMGSRQQFNPQISAPPTYHAAQMGPRGPHSRWPPMRPPYMGQGPPGGPPGAAPGAPPPPANQNNQSSALIAQLSQPPSAALHVQPSFAQRIEGAPNANMPANPQQAQQQQMNQQHQLRLNMQVQQQQQQQMQQNAVQQQNAQQATMGMQPQPVPGQPGLQHNVAGVNASMASQVPQNVATSQASTAQVAPVSTSMAQQGNGAPGPPNQPMVNADRTVIWKGMLEWVEKTKTTSDPQTKQTWQVPCSVAATVKDGEAEVKAESWPMKLIMQLMPKVLIGNIGQAYLKNSKSVVFFPSQCEALESLIKVMSNGFAGCVHFTATATCNIKVLLLLYTAEKRTFLGFIPNDQQAFVDRLRKVIQQQKSTHASMVRQGPVPLRPTGPGTGPGAPGSNVMPGNPPNTGISQSGIMMSQTNTMTMGGGQITQNVIPNNGIPQQSMASSTVQQSQLNIQAVSMPAGGGGQQGQMNSGGGQNVMGGQMDLARQHNLLKIQQLQQTLEAAQQQEAQFKAMEGVGNIQQNLEHAQAQELQYKQMEAQRNLNAGNQGMQAPSQPNAPRMIRPPGMSNTVGLRHLLQQQQQPQQFRQVLHQQQMVGNRPMGPRQMAPGNPQNQQFEDNYDF